ncbi:MAG: type II toxin-antitoxin system Phd/YefM family antitoxin [Deltaproteobacteria bacterium]|jgi:hypothetical protein|nr:type II toxin-antitoxin system Phd/YefM family antitoxin [Deltaproteobacteria bacterium]
MRIVKENELSQTLAEAIDTIKDESVVIQNSEKDVAVLMSLDEYNSLKLGQNISLLQFFCDNVGAKTMDAGMTEDLLKNLLSSDD